MNKQIITEQVNSYTYDIHVNTELPQPVIDYLKRVRGVDLVVKKSNTKYQLTLTIGRAFDPFMVLKDFVTAYINY